MIHDRWERLNSASWLAFAAHLIAGAAMALILHHGLETTPDPTERLRFVAHHRLLWTAGWLSWTIAAGTILYFYARFAAAHRSGGAAHPSFPIAIGLTVLAVAADCAAQAIEVFVLPGFAGSVDTAGFLAWHRSAVLLTGFLANGLYTISAFLLVWATRDTYAGWTRAAGFGVVAGGLMLSVAAAVDSPSGMLLANVLLVPCLLGWLAGVAISRPLLPRRSPH